MIRYKYLITILLVIIAMSLKAQTRVGSCKGATSSDRIYITPFIGGGFANGNFNGTKTRFFNYQGGLTVLYGFEKFRLGLGGKYQVYSKEGRYPTKVVKPFLVAEVPIYFGDFEDFGFYTHIGPWIPQKSSPTPLKESAFYIDLGIYYNLVITPSSSLFFGLDYGYNYISFQNNTASGYSINEFKLNIGYRFWF